MTAILKVFECEDLASEIFECLAPGPFRLTDTIQDRFQCEQAGVDRARICVLVRDISAAEWERFQQYANRVRELYIGAMPVEPVPSYYWPTPKPLLKISPTVWTLPISRWCSRSGLCPNLERLGPLVLSTSSPGPLLLVPQKLRHLQFDFVHSPDSTNVDADRLALRGLVSALHCHFESLESFSFHSCDATTLGLYAYASLDMESSHDFRALKNVELNARYLSPTSALLAFLERLNLDTFSLEIKCFRASLRELRLAGPYEVLSVLVAQWAGPGLKTLELMIECIGVIPNGELGETFDRLLSLVPDSVCRLWVRMPGRRDSPFGPPKVLASTVLTPLLPKVGLTDIALKVDNANIELHANDLAAADNAWPHLNALRIEASDDHSDSSRYYPPPIDSMPTLQDVIRFIKHHHALRHLSLPYMHTDTLPELSTIDPLEHDLETFRLSVLHIKHGHRTLFEMALLFDKLFPNLDVSAARVDDRVLDERAPSRWREVERYILAFRAGRTSAGKAA
ncbi:hypothetical protein OH77DRAFT_1517760 [Trametes cingulata]|nr:hypothetical protein OH77DRAFT_1517760 [Trametes cingulata]